MKLVIDTLGEAETVFNVLINNGYECKLEADSKEVCIYFYEPAKMESRVLNE